LSRAPRAGGDGRALDAVALSQGDHLLAREIHRLASNAQTLSRRHVDQGATATGAGTPAR
jgi:hypothetical protein